MKRFVICLWLAFLPHPLGNTRLHAQNQPVKFEHLGSEHLASLSTVYCILQDQQGFMWFGTQGGVYKFDGYQFTLYQRDLSDSTSLSNNAVSALCEDHTGALWIGTYGGLNRFDRNNDRFARFAPVDQKPHFLDSYIIYAIYEDRANVLWVGTNLGFYKFDSDREQLVTALPELGASHLLARGKVFSLLEDHAGMFWIGTARGLYKRDPRNGQLTRFIHDDNNPHSLSHNVVWRIYEDRDRTLWFGTEGGGLSLLNVEDREAGNFTRFVHDPADPYSLSQNIGGAICEDRFGSLWVGTGNGLNRFEREQKRFIRFHHDEKDSYSLSDNSILSIYEDRAGVLWIGTFFGGINKWDRGQARFTTVAHDSRDPHSLNSNIIASFYEDRSGALWVGTNGGGVNRLNPASKRFTHFMHDPKNPYSLSHNLVGEIIEDRTGALWIGTGDGGFNKFDRKTERFTHPILDPNHPRRLAHDIPDAIYPDTTAKDILWLRTGGGLNKLDLATNQFTRFVHNSNDPLSLSDNSVWAICAGNSPFHLWVATVSGLNRFDLRTEKFTRYIHDQKNPFSLSHSCVFAILKDRFGTLWAGTAQGLNRFDEQSERFTHYSTKDGLPHNTICSIQEDAGGRLWLSTDQGISCFDPQAKVFRNYDATDGLPSNSFMAGAGYTSAKGEMFFGSFNSGFTRFHPDSIKDNPYIPPVAITTFKRYNTDDAEGIAIEEKGISAKKEIKVSYKDNVLNFEFAALSYRNTFKNQYAYKLEGFNDNWIQLGTKHDVTFTNLDPGEYTLRVKGSNNDGVWNEEGASLKIKVTPPWWRTRWAYAAYLLLFGAALYGWRRYDLNRIHLKNQVRLEHIEAEKIRELDHMKSRFFANISHEFRTPLTLILGPVEQMRGKEFKGNIDEAYDMILRNGRRLLRLINQLLDLARLEAGRMSLQARAEDIVSFLKGLVLSFASAAERKRIALSIFSEEENLIVYFDRDKLEKIVSNLLSNALKFAPEGGEVEVVVSRALRIEDRRSRMEADGFVEICVKDTGPGIPTEQLDKIFDRFYKVDASHTREHEGTGIGLALTKELVELHHGGILVQSELGQGTTFIVRLPLGKEHLKAEEVVDARIEDRGLKIEDRTTRIEEQGASITQPATSNEQPETSDDTIVLIVEDNHDVRQYIRQYLEPAFKVIEAVDGLDGVEKGLEIIPDLIISDVMMPKRDGNELCRILKTEEKTSHVPIIMLTAKADRDSKVQGLETGADDYLIKPFDSKELLARVHNLINQRRQLRERFSREIVLKPQDIAITSRDEVFLNKVKTAVERHLSDEDFEVESLSHEVGMSRVHLHRKLKALTNQSTSQFIRTIRLQRAVELLKHNAGTVAEIAYEVGFGSQAYFTKCFHEQFGCVPKEYVKKSTPTQEA